MRTTPEIADKHPDRLVPHCQLTTQSSGGIKTLHYQVKQPQIAETRSFFYSNSAPACSDAKLAVLEWDDATDRFRTSSLHYFEGDAALRGGRRTFARGPKAICDPQVCSNRFLA